MTLIWPHCVVASSCWPAVTPSGTVTNTVCIAGGGVDGASDVAMGGGGVLVGVAAAVEAAGEGEGGSDVGDGDGKGEGEGEGGGVEGGGGGEGEGEGEGEGKGEGEDGGEASAGDGAGEGAGDGDGEGSAGRGGGGIRTAVAGTARGGCAGTGVATAAMTGGWAFAGTARGGCAGTGVATAAMTGGWASTAVATKGGAMARAAVTSEGAAGDIGGTLVALPPWFARDDFCAAASSSRDSWPLPSESSCSKAARISCRDSCLGKAAIVFAWCACDAALLWPGLTAMAQMPRTPSSMSKAVADSLCHVDFGLEVSFQTDELALNRSPCSPQPVSHTQIFCI